MILFVAKRLLSGVVLVFVVTLITFAVTHINTHDIASSVVGVNSTPAQVDAKYHELGFDQPLPVQYWNWLTAALHGDLGRSYYTSQSVLSSLMTRLPVTLSIVVLSIVLTALISTGLGVAAAVRGGALDRVLQTLNILGYVLPGLLIAIVLVVVFAITLKVVPATGYVDPSSSVTGWFGSIILPAIALTFGGVAGVAAQVRGSMVDELGKDYVRTLRSRGMSTRAIVFRHALRNASGPGFTTLSLQFIGMIGGALIIEQIFALPGFGQYAYEASIQRDIPSILGVVAFSVLVVVAMNVIVDIATGLLNPKARVK